MKKTSFTGTPEKRKMFYKRYGFYIALFVLSFVIGLTSYYRVNQNEPEPPERISNELDTENIPLLATPKPLPPAVSTPAPQSTDEPKVTEDEVEQEVRAASVSLAFIRPVGGEIIVDYSPETLVYSKTMGDWRVHKAVNFAATEGDEVLSAADGVVEKVYADAFYGNTVVINHGGTLRSIYSALSSTAVSEGQEVSQGEIIGKAGNSAPIEAAEGVHLHFAAEMDGVRINPMELIDGEI